MLETNFSENHEVMGLVDDGNNCYSYQDQYSEIKYMQLQTKHSNYDVPTFAIYVRDPSAEVDADDPLNGFRYVGNVSGSYKFTGNDIITQTIRDSISTSGQAIFREYPIMVPNLTGFMNEMVIEHPTTIEQVGTIRPQINLTNSYNGTSLTKVSFGFSVYEPEAIDVRTGFSFNTKMITLKQVHAQNSQTLMTGAVSGYVDIFAANISDLITQNFETPIPTEDAMKVLDMIEKAGVGKTRTSAITEYFESIENKTMWNVFHAISRFSTNEGNLNAKRILENVAESVLTVPTQMIDAISSFNQNMTQQLQAA